VTARVTPGHMLIAGAIVLGALLLFRLNLYEYQPAGGSGPGGAPPLLRINRLTGHAEPFVNGRWIGSVARPLPAADLSRLVGYAALGPDGVFRGNLHNGSGWTITRLVIRLSLNVARPLPNEAPWTRTFQTTVFVPPLSTSLFAVTVTDPQEERVKGLTFREWAITEAFGFPPS
jgi:hypothetical protein